MHFAHPQLLYLLALVPLLALLILWAQTRRRRAFNSYGEKNLVRHLVEHSGQRAVRGGQWLQLLAFVLVVLMLARPQGERTDNSEEHEGVEIILAVDISNSMLATDVQPSRIDRARQVTAELAERLAENRLGIVAFAASPSPQMPISSDRYAIRTFIDALTEKSTTHQGTNIAKVIDFAANSFGPNDDMTRAIVVITDAEAHEGDAEHAAALAKSQGTRVYVLGIGTEQGSTIPTDTGALTDLSGNAVVSALNKEACSAIADKGGGSFYHVDASGEAVARLVADLGRLPKTSFSSDYHSYREYFPYIAFLLVLVLAAEGVLRFSDHPMLKRVASRLKPNKRHAKLLLALTVVLFCTTHQTAYAQKRLERARAFEKGNKAYGTQRYRDAAGCYQRGLDFDSACARLYYNRGCAELRNYRKDEAFNSFSKAAELEGDTAAQASAYYNRGVMQQRRAKEADDEERQQLLRQAIDDYKQALRRNPHDEDARKNLEICRYQLKTDKQEQQQQNQQDDEQKQDEQNEKQPQSQNQNQPPQNQLPPQPEEQTQRLMNLVEREERKTREKLQSAKEERDDYSSEKYW